MSRRGSAVLIVLASLCGVLAVGWKAERDRRICWQEVAEEGVSAAGRCH